MAISQIKPIKCWKGKSTAAVVKDRLDYYMNPRKTDNGRLISCFQCEADTAAEEFMTVKRLYAAQTGRTRPNTQDAVLWRIIQSFKPGEISPEEANLIGYEFAREFLKDAHQFTVCTHVDKHHIHNHIVWNSVALDPRHKWNNFYHSAYAVRAINDRLCREHGLTVVRPKEKGRQYKEWDCEKQGGSWKAKLRETIDALLSISTDFDDFLARMRQAGYEVKAGKHIAFRAAGQERFTRAKTLGENYTEEALRARLQGSQRASGRKASTRKAWSTYMRTVNLLIDIPAKLADGKGPGFERWAKLYNLKEAANTLNFLMDHGIADYDTLVSLAKQKSDDYAAAVSGIRQLEGRMAEISALEKHEINYSKTREIFQKYKASGYSAEFRMQHKKELTAREAAKRAFDALHAKKLPKMAQLRQEYAELLKEKQAKYAESHALKAKQYELQTAIRNVDQILHKEVPEKDPRDQQKV